MHATTRHLSAALIVAIVSLAALVSKGCTTTQSQTSPWEAHQSPGQGSHAADSDAASTTNRCGTATALKIKRLVNRARQKHDLPPVRCSPRLAKVARQHSGDMCRHNSMGHRDSRGRTSSERLKAAGFRNTWTGENVAHGQPSAEAVHRAWMRSPGHRKNILNPKFRRIGVGMAPCGGRAYWTQNFAGKPSSERSSCTGR